MYNLAYLRILNKPAVIAVLIDFFVVPLLMLTSTFCCVSVNASRWCLGDDVLLNWFLFICLWNVHIRTSVLKK